MNATDKAIEEFWEEQGQVPPSMVVIHKDRITEMECEIAELKRQAEELFPISHQNQERAERATHLLLILQWSQRDEHGQPYCPICAMSKSDGHSLGCELAKLIGGAE